MALAVRVLTVASIMLDDEKQHALISVACAVWVDQVTHAHNSSGSSGSTIMERGRMEKGYMASAGTELEISPASQLHRMARCPLQCSSCCTQQDGWKEGRKEAQPQSLTPDV